MSNPKAAIVFFSCEENSSATILCEGGFQTIEIFILGLERIPSLICLPGIVTNCDAATPGARVDAAAGCYSSRFGRRDTQDRVGC